MCDLLILIQFSLSFSFDRMQRLHQQFIFLFIFCYSHTPCRVAISIKDPDDYIVGPNSVEILKKLINFNLFRCVVVSFVFATNNKNIKFC